MNKEEYKWKISPLFVIGSILGGGGLVFLLIKPGLTSFFISTIGFILLLISVRLAEKKRKKRRKMND